MAYSLMTQTAEQELLRRREYSDLVHRVRSLAASAVPEGSVIAVVSKGDPDLLRIEGRVAQHFPRTATGAYVGHHPADDADAIGRLEAARGEGARFLLLPATALWWLDHYAGLARHLETHYRRVADQPDSAIIFSLEGSVSSAEQVPDQWSEALARNVRSVVTALLPAGAKVLLASDSGRTSPIDGLAVKPFRPEATAAKLESERSGGAEYLVIPNPTDWLAGHAGLRAHLESSCLLVTHQEHACAIYDLRGDAIAEPAEHQKQTRTARPRAARKARQRGGQRRSGG